MKLFTHIDLGADPEAGKFVKDEIVAVSFAGEPGSVASREGANRFSVGDALIIGSTGDRWSVSRDRFDAKYTPLPPLRHGEAGNYRNIPRAVWAKQISEPFAISRSAGGDTIRGEAGDWLLEYGAGDYGIVAREKFAKVYRRME